MPEETLRREERKKVVLVWNEHPTEVVAGVHARRVADILRKKYHYEVILEKIPLRHTLYVNERLLKRSPMKIGRALLRRNKDSFEHAEQFSTIHGEVPVFSFHNSPPELMGSAKEKRPSNFTIDSTMGAASSGVVSRKAGAEISFYGEYSETGIPLAIIETPALFSNLGSERLARRSKVLTAVVARANALASSSARPSLFFASEQPMNWLLRELTRPHYQLAVTTFKANKKKYLSPVIAEKIAAAIHEKLLARK